MSNEFNELNPLKKCFLMRNEKNEEKKNKQNLAYKKSFQFCTRKTRD